MCGCDWISLSQSHQDVSGLPLVAVNDINYYSSQQEFCAVCWIEEKFVGGSDVNCQREQATPALGLIQSQAYDTGNMTSRIMLATDGDYY